MAPPSKQPQPPQDPDKVWIYHERQEALLCGQHALNNLAQAPVFSYHQLAAIAHQLDQLELNYLAQSDKNDGSVNLRNKDYLARLQQGSENVDGAGNFSIQVLKAAFEKEYGVTLPHLSQQDLLKETSLDITDFCGFLCHKSDHWFAMRQIGGRFWNLDSMLEMPVAISHFQLAHEMKTWGDKGYTIFCVPTGLPAGGVKVKPVPGVMTSGTGNWHKMSNLLRGQSTAADPWQGVGSGMRLDGRNTTATGTASTATTTSVSDGANDFMAQAVAAAASGLTEDEQLQLALQASMEPTPAATPVPATIGRMPRVVSDSLPPVPPEPAAGLPGTVRIQFRLPASQQRCVRRFYVTDSVLSVYAFCQDKEGGKALELKYGFPPRDLRAVIDETVGTAGLGGQSLTGRYLA
jgi:ataxin-3